MVVSHQFQIQISTNESDDDADVLKSVMMKEGREVVRKQVSLYLDSLKVEFSKGMILPKKDEVKPDAVKNLTSGFNKKINMEPVISDNKNVGLKVDTGTLKLTKKFQCKAEEFYNVMVRIEMVTAFTRGAVKLDPFKGGKFDMFGGNITGTFLELVPGKKIVQEWRYKQWPTGHHSIVTFSINEKVKLSCIHFINKLGVNYFKIVTFYFWKCKCYV